MQPAGLCSVSGGLFFVGNSVIRGVDPKFMARRCREQAEATNDASLADVLRRLADDYDAVAKKQDPPENR